MDPALFPAIARAVDGFRRRFASCRTEQLTADVPRGWICWEPGSDGGEFPSGSPNRLHWFAAESPLTPAELHETFAIIRAKGPRRMYILLSPRAWSMDFHRELSIAGAAPFPNCEYPVLVCAAEPIAPERPTAFSIRIVHADEAPRVFTAATWYERTWAQRAQRMLDRGISHLHAAFEGRTPVALNFLSVHGDFGYLGPAQTDPAIRGRGAQSALICSRVTHAAQLGATWCISETNTAVPISLGNLKRCGFEPIFSWHAYRWDDPSPS